MARVPLRGENSSQSFWGSFVRMLCVLHWSVKWFHLLRLYSQEKNQFTSV